jgi:hypothetical protein
MKNTQPRILAINTNKRFTFTLLLKLSYLLEDSFVIGSEMPRLANTLAAYWRLFCRQGMCAHFTAAIVAMSNSPPEPAYQPGLRVWNRQKIRNMFFHATYGLPCCGDWLLLWAAPVIRSVVYSASHFKPADRYAGDSVLPILQMALNDLCPPRRDRPIHPFSRHPN